MTQDRWVAEVRIVRENIPDFRPFIKNGYCGFVGYINRHRVQVQAPVRDYPAVEPKLYIEGATAHTYADGSICSHRVWRPERSTFANCILIAMKYAETWL